MSPLEQTIRQHIAVSSRPNSQGWYTVLCKVCNDHGRKGKRAGFRFDGDSIGYNCFNCGHTALFDPSNHQTLSKDMTTVLEAFGMERADWQSSVFQTASKYVHGDGDVKVEKKQNLEPSVIEFPSYFTSINPNGDDFDLYAIEYLRDERGIKWHEYPFMIGRQTSNPSSKKWHGRLIIPMFKDGKLVFYQGRDLSGTRQRKYLSPDFSRENVLYGYEHLKKDTEEPIYIVEGWFDAFHLEGVAVLGAKMSPHQLYWIEQSQRPKVVIPDRTGDGYRLAEQALERGWSISTPDVGDCKDPNEAIMKYGKLYTLMTIKSHTYDGFEAALRLKFYCEKSNNDDARRSPHIRKGPSKK